MTQGAETVTKVGTEKRRLKDLPPTKVLIRRLPPSLTAETLLEQISPLPNYDFFYFMRADSSLGANAFSRAYINFPNYEDIANFRDKFDDYIFVDPKGNEYPAIVEFSAFQKVPKKRIKKPDSKKGTIEQDPDYEKFLESLEHPEEEPVTSLDTYLEELEAREREAKGSKGGPKVITPLIEYIKKRKEEKRNAILRAREEKKKRDIERRQAREEERRKRREQDFEKEKDVRRLKERDGQRGKGKEDKDAGVKLLKHSEKEESKSEKDVDKLREEKKDRETSDKSKDDKSRLRFSKENREKIKEQREERKDDRMKSSPVKSDRPRSGRDDWSSRDGDRGDKNSNDQRSDRDRPRPKSYREEREQRRQNRESDYYRDERPRSGAVKKDERRNKDDPRERVRSRGQKPDGGRSDYRKNERDMGRSDRDKRLERPGKTETTGKANREPTGEVVKAAGDTSKTEKERDLIKERERPKSETKPYKSRDNSAVDDSFDKKEDSSGDDRRRKRKERPERAIYDPRKALERRQGTKKESDQSPRDSPREKSGLTETGDKTGTAL